MNYNSLKNNFLSKTNIAVDGSCVKNGMCYYRGVNMKTGEELFHVDIGLATNNIAEFLAICHAVWYCEKNFIDGFIFTDSKTAMSWVRRGKVNTTSKDELVIERIKNAIKFIKGKKIKLKKWDTRSLGEIPADFGNKKKSKRKSGKCSRKEQFNKEVENLTNKLSVQDKLLQGRYDSINKITYQDRKRNRDYYDAVILNELGEVKKVSKHTEFSLKFNHDNKDYILWCGANKLQECKTAKWIPDADTFIINDVLKDKSIPTFNQYTNPEIF